jgi:YhcH/YjgK/YiaL family protein
MILDSLSHGPLYRSLHPRLAQAIVYLQSGQHTALEPGRHPIDGDNLIAIVQEHTTQPMLPDTIWEAHRKYMDVQFMARGAERHGRMNLDTAKVTKAYDEAADVMFLAPGDDFVTIRQDHFAIYFPHDVHAPGLCVDLPAPVRKIVMKVKL